MALGTAVGIADGTDDGLLLGTNVGRADGIGACGVGCFVGTQVGAEHNPPGRGTLAEGSVTITDITLLTLCRAATTARLNAAAVRVAYTWVATAYGDVAFAATAKNESVQRNAD